MSRVRRGVVVPRHPRRRGGARTPRPLHGGAEAALAAGLLRGRDRDRHRHDRAERRLRSRRAQDHGGPRRRRLDRERLEDVHHQRLQRRPRGRRRTHHAGPGRQGGITLFGIETGMEGFTCGRKPSTRSARPSPTPPAPFFTDVRVPDANRIGEVDRGFISMMERLPQERLGAAVSNVAHAAAILEETLEYVKQRKAFGQSIGSFQHNKFLLAEPHHPDRGVAGVRRPVRAGVLRRRAQAPSTPPRPSGGRRRCRTTCSTRACSSTAATAS